MSQGANEAKTSSDHGPSSENVQNIKEDEKGPDAEKTCGNPSKGEHKTVVKDEKAAKDFFANADIIIQSSFKKIGKQLKKYKFKKPDIPESTLIQNILQRKKELSWRLEFRETCSVKPSTILHSCSLYVRDYEVGFSEPSPNKLDAKLNALQKAFKFLTVDIQDENDPEFITELDRPKATIEMLEKILSPATVDAENRKRKADGIGCYNDFLLVEAKTVKVKNAGALVEASMQANKKELKKVEVKNENSFKVSLYFEGMLIAEGVNHRLQDANRDAKSAALKELRRNCWTVFNKLGRQQEPPPKIKKGEKSTPQEEEDEEEDPELKPNSIDTIINSVDVVTHGFPDVHGVILKAIQDYKASNSPGDLVFRGFSKEHRQYITKCGIDHGLKSHGYWENQDRQIRLMFNRPLKELFLHVARQGGETGMYLLLPPM